MSNIPYPNVPPLPGVPPLNRAGAYFGAALTAVAELLPLNTFGQEGWGIIETQSRSIALTPDSFVKFEERQEAKIPIYPMQEGAFQSYNKVLMPYECRLTVTCSGNGPMSKLNFLSKISYYIETTTLVDIATPDGVYVNMNLVHVDYRREAKQGATLIIAELWFQWVRVVSSTVTTAEPSGASPSSLGQLSTQSSTLNVIPK